MSYSREVAVKVRHKPWSSLVVGDEGCIGPSSKQIVLMLAHGPL